MLTMFAQWPEDSRIQFETMLRTIFREEVRAALMQETIDDADYLASLPPAERKAKLKEMMG